MMMMIEIKIWEGVVCLYRQIRMQGTGNDSRWAVEGRSQACISNSQFD